MKVNTIVEICGRPKIYRYININIIHKEREKSTATFIFTSALSISELAVGVQPTSLTINSLMSKSPIIL